MKYKFDEIIDRSRTNSFKWKARELKNNGHEMYPMWVADMDFRVPECVVSALREYVESGVYGYYKIPDAYYQAFIDWEREHHGYEVKKEWIRFSPGVVAGFHWLLQILTEENDAVIVNTPVYYPFLDAVKNNHRNLICSDLKNENGEYSIDFDDFEKKITDHQVKLFILCSPHNPAGRVWKKEELKRLFEICRAHQVHSNNGTTDLNAWVNLFKEFADSIGADVDMNQMYGTLYNKALEGDADCGGILSYGNYAGEPITNVEKGRPMVVRTPETKFTLANFMRSHLYTALGVIKVGKDILKKDEGVEIDTVLGHGGLFKTKGVGQKILADAINTPVVVMETAGEGGPWGMAILAEYMVKRAEGEKLEDYLKNKVFGSNAGSRIDPDPEGVAGYEAFMETYKKGLDVERRACADL